MFGERTDPELHKGPRGVVVELLISKSHEKAPV